MADDDPVQAVEQRKDARKLQELFKGRFSEEESLELLRTHGTLADAADFVLNGDPAEVRKLINDRNQALVDSLRRDSEYVNEALQAGLEKSIRLFACEDCDRYWWRKVPARKEVSKCHRCCRKYDPVPKHEEWGLGEFVCVCGKTFWGTAWMNHTESPCYGCGFSARPRRIVPPTRQHQQRNMRSRHSCTGHNCYNRASGFSREDDHQPTRSDAWGFNSGRREQAHQNAPEEPQQEEEEQQQQRRAASSRKQRDAPICSHEQSAKDKRVLYPSQPHVSTGSTVNTFMSQGSLAEDYDEVDRMPRVAEVEED